VLPSGCCWGEELTEVGVRGWWSGRVVWQGAGGESDEEAHPAQLAGKDKGQEYEQDESEQDEAVAEGLVVEHLVDVVVAVGVRAARGHIEAVEQYVEKDVKQGLPEVLEVERIAGHGQVQEHNNGVGAVHVGVLEVRGHVGREDERPVQPGHHAGRRRHDVAQAPAGAIERLVSWEFGDGDEGQEQVGGLEEAGPVGHVQEVGARIFVIEAECSRDLHVRGYREWARREVSSCA